MQSSLGLIIVPETDDYKPQPELNLFLDEVYGVTSKPLSDAHSHNLPRGYWRKLLRGSPAWGRESG